MPVKIKTDLKVVKKLNEEVKAKFRKEITTGSFGYELIRTIQDIIRKGISPVDGEGRFQRYSDSYRSAIKKGYLGSNKRPSPVSMFLSGEMLGSLKLIEKGKRLFLQFDDKKAAWHQNGKGKLPKRKLLPSKRGETFNKRIVQIIIKALKQAVRKK
jgi:hypothetical protein